MRETCFECDGEAVLVREPRPVTIGRHEVTAEGDFMRCESCGNEYFLPGQMDALLIEASRKVREREGWLQPEEILAFRRDLDISQSNFELLLGVGPKTAGRWERGTVFQGNAVDKLIRIMRRYPDVTREMADEAGIEIAAEYGRKRAYGGAWEEVFIEKYCPVFEGDFAVSNVLSRAFGAKESVSPRFGAVRWALVDVPDKIQDRESRFAMKIARRAGRIGV